MRCDSGSTGSPDATSADSTTSVIPGATGNGAPARACRRTRMDAGVNPSPPQAHVPPDRRNMLFPVRSAGTAAGRWRHEALGDHVAHLSRSDADHFREFSQGHLRPLSTILLS